MLNSKVTEHLNDPKRREKWNQLKVVALEMEKKAKGKQVLSVKE